MFRVTLLLALAGLRIGYTHAQTTESIRYRITQPTAVGLTGNTYKLPADSLVRQGVAVARYDKRFSGTNRTDALAKLPQPPLPADTDRLRTARPDAAFTRFGQIPSDLLTALPDFQQAGAVDYGFPDA